MHKQCVRPRIQNRIVLAEPRLLGSLQFSISEAEVNNACPFYCVVSNDGIASAVGSSLLKLLGIGEQQFVGESISRWFDMDDDGGLNKGFSLESVAALRHRPFKLVARMARVELACEVVSITVQNQGLLKVGSKRLLMVMRPLFGSYAEVEEAGLSLQDFSLTDPIRTNILSMLMEESLRDGLMSALGEIDIND